MSLCFEEGIVPHLSRRIQQFSPENVWWSVRCVSCDLAGGGGGPFLCAVCTCALAPMCSCTACSNIHLTLHVPSAAVFPISLVWVLILKVLGFLFNQFCWWGIEKLLLQKFYKVFHHNFGMKIVSIF